VPLSTALQVSAAGRSAPLKPGVRPPAAIVMDDIRLLRRQGDVPRQPRGGARRRGLGGRWSSTTGTLVSATAGSARRPAPGRSSGTTAAQPPARSPARRRMPTPSACGPPTTAVATVPLAGPDPTWPSRRCHPVTGFSGTWARHGRNDESQELSGGGESHVS
jgi:hypothetical protein